MSKVKVRLRFHLTLETNATLFDPELARYIDLFSLSPKLSSSYTGASPLSIQRLESGMHTAIYILCPAITRKISN